MAEQNPSILSHISLGSNRFDEAVAFYDQVLATLGCKRILEHPGAVAWGREYPEFWVQRPFDGGTASVGNGTHVGFFAADQAAVDAFHRAAIAAGAVDEGAPDHGRSMASPITVASSVIWTVTRSRRPTGTPR